MCSCATYRVWQESLFCVRLEVVHLHKLITSAAHLCKLCLSTNFHRQHSNPSLSCSVNTRLFMWLALAPPMRMISAHTFHYLVNTLSQEIWTLGNFAAAAIFPRKFSRYTAIQQQYFVGNFDNYTCTKTSYSRLTEHQTLKLKAKTGAPPSRIP